MVRDVPGGGLAVTGIGLDGHVTVYDIARQLPAIADLRDLCRSLAMLDAILSPDWEDRYYSMNANWADGEEMASMRNGSGNEYSIVFSTAGAYIRGFDHESPMSPYDNDGEPWLGVIDEVPELFKPFVEESAFTNEDGVPIVTACLWRGATDDRWHHGTIDFPIALSILTERRACSSSWSTVRQKRSSASPRTTEVPVDLEAVSQVYALRPLSPELVSLLNPEVSLTGLAQDIEVGYPQPDQEIDLNAILREVKRGPVLFHYLDGPGARASQDYCVRQAIADQQTIRPPCPTPPVGQMARGIWRGLAITS